MKLDSFLSRKGLNQTSLSVELETTSQNVNRWGRGIGFPGSKICRKLLLMGMTVEELYEIDYNEMHGLAPVPQAMNEMLNSPVVESPRFLSVVKKAVMDLKDRGLIK